MSVASASMTDIVTMTRVEGSINITFSFHRRV
jgi:hypothetical protein